MGPSLTPGGAAVSSEGFHEPIDRLSPETLDHHRAISSIMEEFEAVDWYDQRVDATDDESLAEVLAHNRDEEKEHAAMTLEWLRRRDATLDRHLKTYLFTEGSILSIEAQAEDGSGDGGAAAGTTGDGSLGIGSLQGEASGF
jgi:hypothetical protein